MVVAALLHQPQAEVKPPPLRRLCRPACPDALWLTSLPCHARGPRGACPNQPQVFMTSTHLCIAMEFAPGGDMFEYVVKKNGLREDEARWFFQQVRTRAARCAAVAAHTG